MASYDPITGQPFDVSSTSGITDITTDATLLGKGTPEEPLTVTNPEKDIFLEVDNIEIDPYRPYPSAQDRNGRHAEIDLCHFHQTSYDMSINPTVYEEPITANLTKRYYFFPKRKPFRLSYPLTNITNKEIDKLIIGVELGKQLEQHPTMQHIVANFQKRHHFHTFCDTLFLVQRDYKNTTRLHNLLATDQNYINNDLTEKRYFFQESSSFLYEISNSDIMGSFGYIMGTPYSATNCIGGVIGYNAFSAVNYIEQEYAIFDSIFGIEQYIVQAMYIAGSGENQTLEIELNLIDSGKSQPSEIKKYVSGGIHIYLP